MPGKAVNAHNPEALQAHNCLLWKQNGQLVVSGLLAVLQHPGPGPPVNGGRDGVHIPNMPFKNREKQRFCILVQVLSFLPSTRVDFWLSFCWGVWWFWALPPGMSPQIFKLTTAATNGTPNRVTILRGEPVYVLRFTLNNWKLKPKNKMHLMYCSFLHLPTTHWRHSNESDGQGPWPQKVCTGEAETYTKPTVCRCSKENKAQG